MTSVGSDCPTGKVQWTRDGAAEVVRLRGAAWIKYRCVMCGCYHAGHRRRADKKAEARR